MTNFKEENGMVQLIVGSKGKGKTKELLQRAEQAVKEAQGNIVYLDKSSQHMYELNNKIRLINVSNFPVNSEDGFIGFISGIISQDHDLEYMFLDSFLKIANLYGTDITSSVHKLAELSDKYHVNFIVSVSMDKDDLPESLKEYVAVAL
jgi:thymidine kinase